MDMVNHPLTIANLTRLLSLPDRPVRHFKMQRAFRNILEQSWFRSGQPDLTASFGQLVEEGCAPLWVEMGCDFVEQQNRPLFAPLGNQVGMGQYDGEQQCLLFTGRTFLGWLLFCGVKYAEVCAMGAMQGPAG